MSKFNESHLEYIKKLQDFGGFEVYDPEIEHNLIEFVKGLFAKSPNDKSHDIEHVMECWVNCKELAKSIGFKNHIIISFCALLHETYDAKLSHNKHADEVIAFCKGQLPQSELKIVLEVIKHTSYSKKKLGWKIKTLGFSIKEYLMMYFALHITTDCDIVLAYRLQRAIDFAESRGNKVVDNLDIKLINSSDADFVKTVSNLKNGYKSSGGSTVFQHMMAKLIHLNECLTFDESKASGIECRKKMIDEMSEYFPDKKEFIHKVNLIIN